MAANNTHQPGDDSINISSRELAAQKQRASEKSADTIANELLQEAAEVHSEIDKRLRKNPTKQRYVFDPDDADAAERLTKEVARLTSSIAQSARHQNDESVALLSVQRHMIDVLRSTKNLDVDNVIDRVARDPRCAAPDSVSITYEIGRYADELILAKAIHYAPEA